MAQKSLSNIGNGPEKSVLWLNLTYGLWNWFAEGILESLDMWSREALEFYKQSLMSDSSGN